MIIKQLHVYGYGKWRQIDFPEFQKTQIIYGPNEAGKSTLMAFIEAILFGFPTNKSNERRLEPKDYDGFGGRITVETDDLEIVIIERKKGKATGDVVLYFADGTRGDEESLVRLLKGMTKQMYRAIYSFDIHGLQNVQNLKETDFNRYLLAAGTVGSDVLIRVDNQLQRKRDELFKPNGRIPILNKKLNQLKELESKYKTAQLNNTAFTQLKEKQLRSETQLLEWQNKEKNLLIEQELFTDYLSKWSIYEELIKGKETLKNLQVSSFPQNGFNRFKALKDELSNNENEAYQVEMKLNQILRKMVDTNPFEKLDWDQLGKYLSDWSLYQERERQLQMLRGSANNTALIPAHILEQVKHEEFKQAQEVIRKIERLDWEREQRLSEESVLAIKIERQKEQCDETEKRIQQAEQSPDFIQTTAKTTHLAIILSLAALAVLLLGWLVMPIFYIGGILLGLLAILSYKKVNKKQQAPQRTNSSIVAEWEKLWQQQCAELDELQFEKTKIQKRHSEITEDMVVSESWLNKVAEKLELPLNNHTLFLSKFEQLVEQVTMEKSNIAEQEQVKQLIIKQNDWLTGIQALTAEINDEQLDWLNLDESINSLLAEQRRYHLQTEEVVTIRKEKEDLSNHKERLFATIERIEQQLSSLLQEADVEDDKSFYSKAEMKQQAMAIEERLQVLQMQISEKERHTLSQFNDKVMLLAQLEQIKQQRKELSERRSDLQKEQLEINHQIQLLTQGEVYADTAHAYFLMKSEVEELSEEWMRYKTAQQLVNEMVERLQAERLPRVLQQASEYLSYLTEGRYVKIDFYDEELLVHRKDKFQFTGEELSQGTKEQLYLSIRFAFIEVLGAAVKLPIIIDDSFVNFDKNRTDLIMSLLDKIKLKQQIIYFTCHAYMKEYLPPENCLDLTQFKS